MGRRTLKMIALASSVLVVALAARSQAQSKTPYPSMAPLDQYLMAGTATLRLLWHGAGSAVHLSRCESYGPRGRTAMKQRLRARTALSAWVERAGMNPFDSPEFWNPKNRSPIRLNPASARTMLPITLMRTKLVLPGKSKEEVKESVKAAICS